MNDSTTEKYHLLVESVRDHAIFMTDPQGTILTWNRGVESILGYPEKEWVGQNASIIFTPEDFAGGEHQKEMAHAAREGRAADVRWHLRKDGSRFWADGVLERIETPAGECGGFVKVLRDATREKVNAKRLLESEEKYRTLFDSIDVGFCIIEMLFDEQGHARDYRFIEANPAFERHTGLVNAYGKTVRELVPGLDDFWFRTYGNVALTGEAVRFENYAPAMGRWFDVYALRIGAPEECTVGLLFTDITARKEAQEALQQSEELLRESEQRERQRLTDIFEKAPAFMATLRGSQHIFEMANPPYYQLVGHREIIGRPVAEALPEVVEQGFIGLLDQVYQTGEPFVGKDVPILLQVEPAGPLEERFLDFSYQPLRDEEGQVSGVLAHGIDLTERKRQEEALRVSEERLREVQVRMEAALLAGDIATWNWDVVNDRMTGDANMAYLFSFDTEAAVAGLISSQQFFDALHPEDRPRAQQAIADVLASGTEYGAEYRVVLTDGSWRWLASRGKVSRDAAGKPVSLFGAVVDIAERVEREQERERLLTQARVRAEREALVNQIGDGIRQSLPPEEIERLAVGVLGRALQTDRCYVFTADAARDSLVIAREWCAEGVRPVAGQYHLSEMGIDVDTVFGSGETLVVSHLQGNEGRLSDQNADANQRFQVSSLVNVPFYEGGRFVGALAVAMAHGAREWTAEEVALTETVAGQLRSTLEAARLQQRERNIAQQLQEALIPPDPPSLPGMALRSFYRPALQEAGVGGDFFDVFPVEKGCTALVVADLSGKGLAAASEVATVRNMLRYALYAGRTIAEAVTDLDRILVEHNLLTGFATLFVGVYDQNEHTLSYVNCGQEPGLIRRASSGKVEQLPPTGPVLGGFASTNGYAQETAHLLPGDVLAVFTDGMTEIGPSRRHLLEIEGVSRLLRDCTAEPDQGHDPQAVVDCLIAGVDAFARGGVGDDMALLVGVVDGGSPREGEATKTWQDD